MTYVTYCVRTDPAESSGVTLANTLAGAGILISGGFCVGVPSSSGNVCLTPSETAVCTWSGPSSISIVGETITAQNYRVIVRDVAEGEALWISATYLQE